MPILWDELLRAYREGRARLEAKLIRAGWMQSLPSRLILGVFSTVVVTSLAVAATATRSTESFLRDEIDQKFPAILDQTAERLELWYGQRQLDVETFARSQIVEEHLRVLSRGSGGRRATRARNELQKYMEYVLQRFSQYQSLFMLGADGEVLLHVGAEMQLPNTLTEELARLERSRVSDLRVVAGSRTQVASAPVAGPQEMPVGSLHAILEIRTLDTLLASEDLSETGRIVAESAQGEVLAPPSASVVRASGADGEAWVAAGGIQEHVLDGERVIASVQRFERFGWNLWVIEPYDAAFAPVVAMIRRVWAVNLAIVLLLGGVAFWIARAMAQPIHDLSLAARKIAEGDEDVAIPVSDRGDEVGVLSRALREMTARLSEKNIELRRANEVLTQLSITDGLTGLHNHRAFHDRLVKEIRRSRRMQTPLCLALFDVDDFKGLNDRYGHATGDRVLAAVAKAMQEKIRETDFLARHGGEEFALLVSVSLEGAIKAAESLRHAIAEATIAAEDGSQLQVAVSAGVAALGADSDAIFEAADRALYRAKHSGKDCVVSAEVG